MAEGYDAVLAEVQFAEEARQVGRREFYQRLINIGLDQTVIQKLDEFCNIGIIDKFDLDDVALYALKEFPDHIALRILDRFAGADFRNVSNKSAYLCGCMKGFDNKDGAQQLEPRGAPNEAKLNEILFRTRYNFVVTDGQRRYGPPPKWRGPAPGTDCEIFCGRLPTYIYEDELILMFEKCGQIWDLRLMINPETGTSKGFAFITYTQPEFARKAIEMYHNHEIRPYKHIRVNKSLPNQKLFIRNIPTTMNKDEILSELGNIIAGFTDVIISPPLYGEDERKNRGFCIVTFVSHKAASVARTLLSTGDVMIRDHVITASWARPQDEPDQRAMSRVRVLFVKNLTRECTEEMLADRFEVFGNLEGVRKNRDYAFVRFKKRENALRALEMMNGEEVGGSRIEVSLARPQSEKKQKQIAQAMESRRPQALQSEYPPIPMPGDVRWPGRGPNNNDMREQTPPGDHAGRAQSLSGLGPDSDDYGYNIRGEIPLSTYAWRGQWSSGLNPAPHGSGSGIRGQMPPVDCWGQWPGAPWPWGPMVPWGNVREQQQEYVLPRGYPLVGEPAPRAVYPMRVQGYENFPGPSGEFEWGS